MLERITPAAPGPLPLPLTHSGGWDAGRLMAHQQRVGIMAGQLARILGIDAATADVIAEAGRLHDIGKLFVPSAVLDKPGPLDPIEQSLMQRHAQWGHAALASREGMVPEIILRVALEHHEKWDGSGYPAGLAGEEISLAARIVSLCDVYDALREQRPYRGELDHRTAMRILVDGDSRRRGEAFDPRILAAMIAHQDVFAAIFDAHKMPIYRELGAAASAQFHPQ